MNNLPSRWDVNPSAPKKRVTVLTKAQVCNHIFCLKVGDKAVFQHPISQRRFSQIVRRAKEAWPELSERQFELTPERTRVRRIQ